MPEFTSDERDGLAVALKRLATQYENLFEASFPDTKGFHSRPTDGNDHPEWHPHAFFGPLLRSVSAKNFMVGLEILGIR
jgi:UDPglucose--hexose-1-phosphate uridylyltransferase